MILNTPTGQVGDRSAQPTESEPCVDRRIPPPGRWGIVRPSLTQRPESKCGLSHLGRAEASPICRWEYSRSSTALNLSQLLPRGGTDLLASHPSSYTLYRFRFCIEC